MVSFSRSNSFTCWMISISNSWFWLSNIYVSPARLWQEWPRTVFSINVALACLHFMADLLRVATDHLQKFITTEHEICISGTRVTYRGDEWLKRHFMSPQYSNPARQNRESEDKTQSSNRNKAHWTARVSCNLYTTYNTGRIITRTIYNLSLSFSWT